MGRLYMNKTLFSLRLCFKWDFIFVETLSRMRLYFRKSKDFFRKSKDFFRKSTVGWKMKNKQKTPHTHQWTEKQVRLCETNYVTDVDHTEGGIVAFVKRSRLKLQCHTHTHTRTHTGRERQIWDFICVTLQKYSEIFRRKQTLFSYDFIEISGFLCKGVLYFRTTLFEYPHFSEKVDSISGRLYLNIHISVKK